MSPPARRRNPDAAYVERFGVLCLACGSWRVHIGVRVVRDPDGAVRVAPALTCSMCHERHVYDEQPALTLVI